MPPEAGILAEGRSGLSGPEGLRRDRRLLLAAAAGLASISWGLLLTSHRPAGEVVLLPHGHGGGSGALASGFALWMVMMVAMMLPAVTPWVLLFSSTMRRSPAGGSLFSAAVFLSGYFAAWTPYSALAALAQWKLGAAGLLDGSDLRVSPAAAGGAVLLAAGLFQLTPWKAACLRHCRNPLGFFLARWRDGPAGAFGMGWRHGLYCLGCCWALMAVAFAAGLMNLLWMAGLTIFLVLEKIAPAGRRLGRLAGLGAVAWGVWLIAGGA